MKIAMIGHKDFPSRSGGVEVFVGGLSTSLVKRGYDVTVYNRGLQKEHNVYDVDGVHARRIFTVDKPSLNATIYSFLATFDAVFRGYDIIHYHAIGPSVPLFIAKLFGKHTVCTVHGLNWRVDKWGGFASHYLKLGERIAAKYADDLIVLSEGEWNYFLEKYNRSAILIPNAVKFYDPLPCNIIEKKYGLKKNEYILYVGRISPEKGPVDLVEAYLKSRTDKKLVLAGPVTECEYCTAFAEKIKGNPNIIHTGYVVGDTLRELYSNCALFVLPSHTEGLSLALLEALSIGAKCLVSDIPENTSVGAGRHLPHPHRAAPNRRAGREQDDRRSGHLRPALLLQPLSQGLPARVHQDGKGAGPFAEPHQDQRCLRPADVLPCLRGKRLRVPEQHYAHGGQHRAHTGRPWHCAGSEPGIRLPAGALRHREPFAPVLQGRRV